MLDEFDGPSMEEILRANGARRDRNGNWWRQVPDSRQPKRRVVENGKVYLETDYTRREVAVGNNPIEAVLAARKANGTHDAFVPGVGWVRNGWKPEIEHPDNIGSIRDLRGSIRTHREEVGVDVGEAEKAVALGSVIEAGRTAAAADVALVTANADAAPDAPGAED